MSLSVSMADSPLILQAAAVSPSLEISMESDTTAMSMISSFNPTEPSNSPMLLHENTPLSRSISREKLFSGKDTSSILWHVAHQQHHIDSQKRLLMGTSQPHILRKVMVEDEAFEDASDIGTASTSGITTSGLRNVEMNGGGLHTTAKSSSFSAEEIRNSIVLTSPRLGLDSPSIKSFSPKRQPQWPPKVPPTTLVNSNVIGDLEPRMNFGYHSSLPNENPVLSKNQLKRVTRQLLHSPQYTINTYNQQFYQNKQQDSSSVGSSPMLASKSMTNVTKREEPSGGGSSESFDDNLITIIGDVSSDSSFSTKKGVDSSNVTVSTTVFNNSKSSNTFLAKTSENSDITATTIEKQLSETLPPRSVSSTSIPSFSEQMNSLLSSQIVTVLPLLNEQNTVIIDENGTIDVFLQLVNEHSLRSCVVKHFKQRWLCKGKASFSFVDMRDFLCHIVTMHEQWKNKSFHQIMEMTRNQKVGKIANISKRTPFIRHDVTNTVAQLCAAFKPCCRVPVFEKAKLVRVVSPADLLCIINQNDILLEIEHATGSFIKNAAKEQILSIMETESLLKAMILMVRHGYSAIPIVSSRNPSLVLEVITVREIQYVAIAQDEIHSENMINDPALKFVRYLRENGHLSAEPYALLSENASLRSMIDVFLKNAVKNTQAIHRIFLINKDNVMTGMVSLTNVIRTIADFLGDFYKVPRHEILPHSHPAHNRN